MMSNKLKVFAPLALVAMCLASCNNKNDSMELKSRMNRVEYDAVDTSGEFNEKVFDRLSGILKEQRGETKSESENSTTYHLGMPDKGAMKTNVEATVNGSIMYDELKMENVNLALKTNYEMYWDVKDSHYAEFRSNDKSWYIVQDANNTYWSAHSYFVDGKEIKERTTLPSGWQKFNEFVRECMTNRGLTLQFMDLGMSGFGYTPTEEIEPGDAHRSISGLFYGKNGSIYKLYDIIKEYVGKGQDFTYRLAMDEQYVDTFLGEITAHLNLKELKENFKGDLPEIIKAIIDYFLAFDMKGTLNFDLFAAWAHNYICQQEYIIKAKDLDVNIGYVGAEDQIPHFIQIKGNANIYFGEEDETTYEVPEGKVDQILSEYTPAY